MHRSTYSRSRDLLHARDPGLFRLQHASRTTLSVLLTGVLLAALMQAFHLPISAIAPGIVFSMLTPMFSSDAHPSARTLTYTASAVCGAAAYLVSAALVERSVMLAQSWQLAVVFVGLLFHVRGSRYVAPGVVALVATYVGLFTHPSAALAQTAVALTLVAWLVCVGVLWLVIPLRAAGSALESVVDAVSLQALAIARIAEHAKRHPPIDNADLGADSDTLGIVPRRATRLSRLLDYRLARLHGAVLAVEDQIRGLPLSRQGALRRTVFALELTTERLANQLRASTRGDHMAAIHALHDALECMRETAHQTLADKQVKHALRTRPLVDAFKARAVNLASSPSAATPSIATALAWRIAIRGAIAAAIAIVIGDALSPERSFWAVVAVYIAFFGVASRSHAVYKSAQRLFGTVAGVSICALLGHTLGTHAALSITAILVCVFFWSYYLQANYALGVLFITILVGLVYGAIGNPLGPILTLRLEETVAGIAGAVAIAVLFLPARTERHIAEQLRHLLRSLEHTVDHCITRISHGDGPCPLESMRQADQKLRVLRSAIEPRERLGGALHCELPEARITGLAASSHWLRNVSCLVEAGASETVLRSDATLRNHLVAELETIRQHLREAASLRRLSVSSAHSPTHYDPAQLASHHMHVPAPRDVSSAVESLRFAVSTLTGALHGRIHIVK